MSNKGIIAILVTTSLSIIAVIAFQVFSTDRSLTVYSVKNSNICFLVPNTIKVELTENGFKYSGGKNYGHIQLLDQGLSKEYLKATINEFEAGYYKNVNVRNYEYKINNSKIIRDEFVYIKKSPLNLVPYKTNCDKFVKHHKNQVIF